MGPGLSDKRQFVLVHSSHAGFAIPSEGVVTGTRQKVYDFLQQNPRLVQPYIFQLVGGKPIALWRVDDRGRSTKVNDFNPQKLRSQLTRNLRVIKAKRRLVTRVSNARLTQINAHISFLASQRRFGTRMENLSAERGRVLGRRLTQLRPLRRDQQIVEYALMGLDVLDCHALVKCWQELSRLEHEHGPTSLFRAKMGLRTSPLTARSSAQGSESGPLPIPRAA